MDSKCSIFHGGIMPPWKKSCGGRRNLCGVEKSGIVALRCCHSGAAAIMLLCFVLPWETDTRAKKSQKWEVCPPFSSFSVTRWLFHDVICLMRYFAYLIWTVTSFSLSFLALHWFFRHGTKQATEEKLRWKFPWSFDI